MFAEEVDDFDLAASRSRKQSSFAAVVVGCGVDVRAARKQECHLNHVFTRGPHNITEMKEKDLN
jgi:predicted small metal-binding protein